MPYRELTSPLDTAHRSHPLAMTWERLKEKLRAHGVPGWGDELPASVPRNENAFQLARWESEGGSRANPSAQQGAQRDNSTS